MNGVTNGLFYMKLALQNIKKNAQTYVPYILTCIGSVMMFDIILTLADNKEIAAMHGGSDMRTILGLDVISLLCSQPCSCFTQTAS